MDMSSQEHELAQTYETLITANHIIDFKNVVDAYGHVSARHPTNPGIFIMSGSVAPGTVSEPSDLIQYYVKDSSPVEPNAAKGYQERFIHSEIYKRFADVNSVIHSHSEAVLPFAMGGVEMRPCFHIAGFLGTQVPNYDINDFYPSDHPAESMDMLVNTEAYGAGLASKFASSSRPNAKPDHNVVIMQNHGFTTIGKNIQQAVYRAVYTHVNAEVQSKTIMLHSAMGRSTGKDMRYLTDKQVIGCSSLGDRTQDRPWGLWVREVEANRHYVNRAIDYGIPTSA